MSDDYEIKFSIDDASGPKHFLLGNNDTVWYRSAEEPKYNILNGDDLLLDIINLIEGAEIVAY